MIKHLSISSKVSALLSQILNLLKRKPEWQLVENQNTMFMNVAHFCGQLNLLRTKLRHSPASLGGPVQMGVVGRKR